MTRDTTVCSLLSIDTLGLGRKGSRQSVASLSASDIERAEEMMAGLGGRVSRCQRCLVLTSANYCLVLTIVLTSAN